jgi:RNA polymerase primary sigma factor
MLEIYLREIGQTPLLTPEQEIELAALIRNGDEEARELMIKSNLLLVVKIARDYANLGLDFWDLVSEGNIGLMRAAERFDPQKGKFSYFAALWVKQQIRRALSNKVRLVRLPCHLIERLSQVRRASSRLSQELDREPSDQELAEELGLSGDRVSQLKTVSTQPVSLDAPCWHDDSDSQDWSETVADEGSRTPFELLCDKDLYDELRGCLFAVLTERERRIISSRFGLDCESETLDEIGRTFSVSRERIRQLEESSLVRLRRALAERETPKFNGHRLPQRCR